MLFGDTHLHTSLSVDAGTFGNRLGLDEAYEAKRFGIEMPGGCLVTTQERAYTSPIWYTP